MIFQYAFLGEFSFAKFALETRSITNTVYICSMQLELRYSTVFLAANIAFMISCAAFRPLSMCRLAVFGIVVSADH